MTKPAPEESAVAAVARTVAADMRRMELKCWKGRRMGEYAVAMMLDGFASRLEGAYCHRGQKIRKRAQARAAAKAAGEDAQ